VETVSISKAAPDDRGYLFPFDDRERTPYVMLVGSSSSGPLLAPVGYDTYAMFVDAQNMAH
jgi:hypothetical protein